MAGSQEFVGDSPTWCPGCGDFAVLRALQDACAELGLTPEEVVLVSGIGCSGKITSYFRSYGFHSIHGRTLPVATGIRLANDHLTVIAAGGDGDGYGIGLNHVIHAIRRDINLTYIVMDNAVYGNTKGQTAPTSEQGYASGSTPYGSRERPIRPLRLALAAGIGFLAQGVSSDPKQLTGLVVEGIRHPGFSLINVISPCVTYDKKHTYAYLRENTVNVDTLPGYESDRLAHAIELLHGDKLVAGLLYRDPKRQPFEYSLPGREAGWPALVDLDWRADSPALERLSQDLFW